MYIHLQSTRVFPSDATSDSFPTSPPSPLLQNPFLASKISLGLGFFVTVLDFLRQSLAWWEEVGSPRVRVVQTGWLGRETVTLRGVLVAACSSVCGSGTDCVTLQQSGPISR